MDHPRDSGEGGRRIADVMLSKQLLRILRDWYRVARPPLSGCFPAVIPGTHVTNGPVSGDACELGLKQKWSLQADHAAQYETVCLATD